MQIQSVGAARTVTGSRHLVRTRHATVLLDCGLFQGRRQESRRKNQELGFEPSSQPVTRVSWFAAKAFCESRGLRLPSEAEWELAAAASATQRDARRDPGFRQSLLDWYARPNAALPEVPHGPPNAYGLSDLHGVIWEWVLDFNNAPVIGDSRGGSEATGLFCGAGAASASDSEDYAAFMRRAMRSSLRADYTTANLGFRCAADPVKPKEPSP